MTRFAIDTDWVEIAGMDRPEVSATYANLRIRVDEEVVTSVHHRNARTTSDTVLVSLYPLAEWIVGNWWFVTEESECPGRLGFLDRHAINRGRSGYCLPDLRLLPEGASFRLEWSRYRYVHAPIDFTSAGSLQLPRDDVVDVLRDFVDKVDERLVNVGIEDSSLQKEWTAIRDIEADADQQAFCRAAAWLGLDPLDVDAVTKASIIDADSRLPLELREDAFRAAPHGQLAGTTIWIEHALKQIGSGCECDAKLKDLQGAPREASANGSPWEIGYQLARTLRQELPALNEVPAPIGVLFAKGEPVVDAGESPATLDGIASFRNGFVCSTSKKRLDSRRFVLARAVFDFLHLDQSQSLLTAARTTRQGEGRAFAAELLAPAAVLQDRLRSGWATEEQIRDLAAELQVSEKVVEHQVRNHQLATISP